MSAGFISISGICGVFFGIGLLYLSMKLTGRVLIWLESSKKEDAA